MPMPSRTRAIIRDWCARAGKAISKCTPGANYCLAFRDGKKYTGKQFGAASHCDLKGEIVVHSASNNTNSALQSEKIRQGPASPGFRRASDPRVEHRASRSCDPEARVLCAGQNDVALVVYP